MRTAIVHYWLLNMRGGEKVVEALCRMLPDADIFTLFYDAESVSPAISSHKVQTSFLQPFRRSYRNLLPLMPLASSVRSARLRSGDQQRIRSGQRRSAVLADPPRVLLPYAHALFMGTLPGLP